MQLRRDLLQRATKISKRLHALKSPEAVLAMLPPDDHRRGGRHSCDRQFLCVFLAVKLALAGRRSMAMTVLDECQTDGFVRELRQFLHNGRLPVSFARLFAISRPVEIWSRVRLNRKFNHNALDSLRGLLRRRGVIKNRVGILDVGTGDGVFLQEILGIISKERRRCIVDLALVDISSDLLSTAIRRIDHINRPKVSRVVAIAKDIRRLNRSDMEQIRSIRPAVSLSAACLHHLPSEGKIEFFRRMKTIGSRLVVIELEGNHDKPKRGSPQLIYSVYFFYKALIEAIDETSMPEYEKRVCKRDFIFKEALQLLSMPRAKRQNYHTSLSDWKVLAKRAGWKVGACIAIPLGDGRPRELIMEFVLDRFSAV